MSDESLDPAPVVAEVVSPHSASFLQRFRWHLLGAGAFLLIVIFLLLGIVIGMAKKNFEKKFYLEQIDKLKTSLSQSLEAREELGKDMTALKVELRAKKDHVEELEAKLAKTESAMVKPAEHAAASAEPEASSGDKGVDYIRLKSGDCVVEGSSAATAAKWRECLKNAKKTPDAKH